jgi:KDO2-lipid IV(A) lauroyltransferase
VHGLASVWGAMLYYLPNRARDTTLKNLKVCFPDLSAKEISRLAKASLTSTASTAMEMGKSWMLPLEKVCSLVTQTEGFEEFKQAAGENRGIILITPHLSNWEIFAQYVCQNITSTFMYQPPKLPALDRLLQRVRSRGGLKLAPTDRKGVSLVLKALHRGELVGVLPDQVPNEEGGEFASFFGEQALTMTLVSKLVARSGAKVFCGCVVRLPKEEGFKLIIQGADQLIYNEDLLTSVRGLNKSVEDCVLMAVEQYQWEYKRFRKQPDGKNFY